VLTSTVARVIAAAQAASGRVASPELLQFFNELCVEQEGVAHAPRGPVPSTVVRTYEPAGPVRAESPAGQPATEPATFETHSWTR
jgi:hypothetical protein